MCCCIGSEARPQIKLCLRRELEDTTRASGHAEIVAACYAGYGPALFRRVTSRTYHDRNTNAKSVARRDRIDGRCHITSKSDSMA
jgi:hypothetical protein